MTSTATEQTPERKTIDLEELLGPKFSVIEPTADRTCDRHPSTYALVLVELPNGGTLELCGNCGRVHFGYEHTRAENKTDR